MSLPSSSQFQEDTGCEPDRDKTEKEEEIDPEVFTDLQTLVSSQSTFGASPAEREEETMPVNDFHRQVQTGELNKTVSTDMERHMMVEKPVKNREDPVPIMTLPLSSQFQENTDCEPDRTITEKEEEAKFKYWHSLTYDTKQHVLQFLDYKTRFSLSICSKADHALEKITSQRDHSISIFGSEKYIDVWIVFKEKKGWFYEEVNCTRRFYQRGEDTVIVKNAESVLEQKEIIWENRNFNEAVFTFVAKWMKKSCSTLEQLYVDMESFPCDGLDISKLRKCKHVTILSDHIGNFQRWVENVAVEFDFLQFGPHNFENVYTSLPIELILHPTVMNAKELNLKYTSPYSDEHLLLLKSRYITLNMNTITDNGINAFLKKWSRGENKTFNKLHIQAFGRKFDVDAITRGLRVRQWTRDELIEEAPNLYEKLMPLIVPRPLLQITCDADPYLSLTLESCEYYFRVLWTGRKTILDGKTMTKYDWPKDVGFFSF